ncbi:hypothetical protein TCAL_15117 [Tigriopus californicus]|uniref:Uncharacterized protein n=1 Tax=Tigriopus californicus TaxID=6832 RepID=A0A553NVM2_TIGCA|nr:hypothetical protein TCAL_15117 [Tigriopus californicus]
MGLGIVHNSSLLERREKYPFTSATYHQMMCLLPANAATHAGAATATKRTRADPLPVKCASPPQGEQCSEDERSSAMIPSLKERVEQSHEELLQLKMNLPTHWEEKFPGRGLPSSSLVKVTFATCVKTFQTSAVNGCVLERRAKIQSNVAAQP